MILINFSSDVDTAKAISHCNSCALQFEQRLSYQYEVADCQHELFDSIKTCFSSKLWHFMRLLWRRRNAHSIHIAIYLNNRFSQLEIEHAMRSYWIWLMFLLSIHTMNVRKSDLFMELKQSNCSKYVIFVLWFAKTSVDVFSASPRKRHLLTLDVQIQFYWK